MEDLWWILPIRFWGGIIGTDWAVLSMTRLDRTFWDTQHFSQIANPPAVCGWEIQASKLPVTELLWVTLVIICPLSLHLQSSRGAGDQMDLLKLNSNTTNSRKDHLSLSSVSIHTRLLWQLLTDGWSVCSESRSGDPDPPSPVLKYRHCYHTLSTSFTSQDKSTSCCRLSPSLLLLTTMAMENRLVISSLRSCRYLKTVTCSLSIRLVLMLNSPEFFWPFLSNHAFQIFICFCSSSPDPQFCEKTYPELDTVLWLWPN